MSDKKQESAASEASEEQANPEAFKADLEKAKKDYLYLLAEFDNFRKNAIKERSDLLKFGAERFARDLLNVVDNFDRAMETPASPENEEKFRQGVQMISEELKSVLSRHGIEPVDSEGLSFDPSVHEALSSEPSDAHPPGHITRVFKKAYKLHDRLLRPAQVVVATEAKGKS